jgi:glycosyltransferase involved in cell wall biosynthesis
MMVSSVLAALGVLASLIWVGLLARMVRHRHRVVRLSDLPDEAPEGGWPALAVIFAARDEAAEVERAVRSMLAQDYPALEVIAVDDRSTDGTGAILDRVAEEDARLRVVHVAELPPGWLGKTHALQAAAESTDAPWLLFTDADVVFAPGALRRAVAYAVGQDVDHVAVAPLVPTEHPGERVFLAMFLAAFAFHSPMPKVEDRRSRAHIGIGAFNLVRAEAFRAVGGFRRLALSVDDDMRLGQALKWCGYRAGFLMAGDDVSVRWHVGAWGMVRGLEKNFFAAIEFRPAVVVFGSLGILWIGAGPFLGLFVGPWWSRAACAIGVAAMAAVVDRAGRQNRVAWYHALAMPLGALLFAYALIRSTWLTLRRGGVRWREHLYPLAELRAHVRSRNAWLREVWKSTR